MTIEFMKKPDLDAADIAILMMLQKDAKVTIKEMSAGCFLSHTAVHSRITKLEALGIIERHTAIIKKKELNLSLVAFVTVRLIDYNENSLQLFRTAISGFQEITQASLTESNDCIIIKVVVEHPSSYERFYHEKLLNIPGIGDINSRLAIAEKKCETILNL